MARRRFFVEQVHAGRAHVTGQQAEHLRRVLRVEIGQRFELSDNRFAYLAAVRSFRPGAVEFEIVKRLESPPPAVRLEALVALVKFDRWELMLEKATELDAESVTPVVTTRVERGLERAALRRRVRWQRLLVEAGQQARRTVLPELGECLPFEEAIERTEGYRYLLDERGEAPPLLRAIPPLPARRTGDRVLLLVGPEGGWTEEEREAARAAGWQPVSLGRTILRTETAVTAALAILNAAWQEIAGGQE